MPPEPESTPTHRLVITQEFNLADVERGEPRWDALMDALVRVARLVTSRATVGGCEVTVVDLSEGGSGDGKPEALAARPDVYELFIQEIDSMQISAASSAVSVAGEMTRAVRRAQMVADGELAPAHER